MFSYEPVNEDELRLEEGEEVIVLEKCDDGWFVGTSARTNMFGTFPGNYVERMVSILCLWSTKTWHQTSK